MLHGFKAIESKKEKKAKEMDAEKMNTFLANIEVDKIADYEHWTVHLDIKQYYLGRVFIWSKRPESISMFDLNNNEWLELKSILADLNKMYEQSFTPDTLNMAFLGNDVEHCHCHVVPRYKEPKIFDEVIFKDENWGHNYSNPNTKEFKISKTTHEKIRSTLKDTLTQVIAKNPSCDSRKGHFF
jgi:diadenosine tetraphosphate (Ap4A) HIT family hydrolase